MLLYFGPLIVLLSFFSHCTFQFILLPQSYYFHSAILSCSLIYYPCFTLYTLVLILSSSSYHFSHYFFLFTLYTSIYITSSVLSFSFCYAFLFINNLLCLFHIVHFSFDCFIIFISFFTLFLSFHIVHFTFSMLLVLPQYHWYYSLKQYFSPQYPLC